MYGVIFEIDDPLRTGSHAYPTSPAPGRVGEGGPAVRFIIGSEGAFFRAPFAISTALHGQNRVAFIPRPWMDCLSALHTFYTLNGFHGGSGSILHTGLYALWYPDGPGRIYAGPLSLVWETDEMGVREAIFPFG